MEKDIFSVIATVNELLHQYGLSEATIRTYQERSFNQIVRQYQESGDSKFRLDFMEKLLTYAEEQHNRGVISRKTWNWRRRGILVLTEVFETGSCETLMFKNTSFLRRFRRPD